MATVDPGFGCGRVDAISAAYRSPFVTSFGTENVAATVAEPLSGSCRTGGDIEIHEVSSLAARPGCTVHEPLLMVAAAAYMSMACAEPVLLVTSTCRVNLAPGLTTSTT